MSRGPSSMARAFPLKATREKASAKKDSDEQARADGLEAALALYKARISEHEMRTKRDELHQALKMQVSVLGKAGP